MATVHSSPQQGKPSTKKPSSTTRAVTRATRWPNNLTDEQFAALCSKLNMAAFDAALREDVARALQEGGDHERTA